MAPAGVPGQGIVHDLYVSEVWFQHLPENYRIAHRCMHALTIFLGKIVNFIPQFSSKAQICRSPRTFYLDTFTEIVFDHWH
jgi:hypothetical protein